jgi:hypothetical protein
MALIYEHFDESMSAFREACCERDEFPQITGIDKEKNIIFVVLKKNLI